MYLHIFLTAIEVDLQKHFEEFQVLFISEETLFRSVNCFLQQE
jgi:hypothetical protein